MWIKFAPASAVINFLLQLATPVICCAIALTVVLQIRGLNLGNSASLVVPNFGAIS